MANNSQRDNKLQKSVEKQSEEKKEIQVHGLQTEFQIGEQVLCYEPDPTKAKMLYEAKILEVDITKDEKGKKVPEFFIHFIGWNKSWDRWVLSDSVLKDGETSRSLQSKLHEKALGFKKKSRSRKRKQDDDVDSVETNSQSNLSTANSSQAEGEDSTDLPVISISIPSILKAKLEDDCYFIKRKKKLLKLPRVPCALKILHDFLEFCEKTDVSESTNENQTVKSTNLDIAREVVQGLQTYLNFTLSTLLLYNFEREQYTKIFQDKNTLKKSNGVPSALKKAKYENQNSSSGSFAWSTDSPQTKRKSNRLQNLPAVGNSEEQARSGSTSVEQKSVVCSPRGKTNLCSSVQSGRKRRGRPRRNPPSSAVRNCRSLPNKEMNTVDMQPLPADEKPSDQQKSISVDAEDTTSKDAEAPVPESEQKPDIKYSLRGDSNSVTKESVAEERKPDSTEVPLSSQNEFANVERLIKKEKVEEAEENYIAVEDSENNARSLRPRRSLTPAAQCNFIDKSSYKKEQQSMPVGACASSLNISEKTDSKERKKNDKAIDQESSFTPFPLSRIDSKSPAEIYGAEHLLRLFVKLPSLLSRTDLDAKKRVLLVTYLEKFLRYLSERANSLFDSEHYSESVI